MQFLFEYKVAIKDSESLHYGTRRLPMNENKKECKSKKKCLSCLVKSTRRRMAD